MAIGALRINECTQFDEPWINLYSDYFSGAGVDCFADVGCSAAGAENKNAIPRLDARDSK